VKELSIQLEIIERCAVTRVSELRSEIETVLKSASTAVDVLIARDFVKANAHGISGKTMRALLDAIDAPWKDLRRGALRTSRATFSDGPKRFTKHLREAVRNDLRA
jgi:hypothetical protein